MPKKTARKTGKGKRPPFKKGNENGKATRFKPGNPGGPGRPPNLDSPRAMLKKYAEEVAPQKLRRTLSRMLPGVDVETMTWAQVVALAHLIQAAKGDMRAIAEVYKQLDDSGVMRIEGDLRHAIHGDITTHLDEYKDVLASIARGSSSGKPAGDGSREPVDSEKTD